ncbi:MAG: type IVB secretion system protein IcmH/DotU [Zoogloeaceae bacterium]|jgi:type VI secretion system protein ImpK|nr:type IVB secretion system protein IcmH/DotU [Azoarcus sp.]MDR1646762.1 type IVB secretion system protein IcmH/DotU [Zoogloeaceae bacterium]
MNSLPSVEIKKTPAIAAETPIAPTLRDLLEDGIYLLFLLRDGNLPKSCEQLNRHIDLFFTSYEKQARNFGKDVEQIEQAKYAFCALMDEIMLSPDFSFRDEWARMPLQLRLFGENFAGERFFDRLEMMRNNPARNIEALEVFHTCLLLGFHGKYLLEGPEKLSYLVHRVGQEIQRVRGDAPGFAPNWKLPHRFQNYMRYELPLWAYIALLASVLAIIFGVYWKLLDEQVGRILVG